MSKLQLQDGWYFSTSDKDNNWSDGQRFDTHTAALQNILNLEATTPLATTTFRTHLVYYVKGGHKNLGYTFSRYTEEFGSELV